MVNIVPKVYEKVKKSKMKKKSRKLSLMWTIGTLQI